MKIDRLTVNYHDRVVGTKNKMSAQRCKEIYEEVRLNCGDLLLCKIKES